MEWKPENHVEGKSILLQVMAWCRHAGGHYLNQFWPRPMTWYGVTGPQSQCDNRFWWNFQDGSEMIQGTSVPMGMDHYLDPHHSEAIMSAMAFQISPVLIVCSTVCSGADQRKHKNSASLAFVRGIHQWPMDSPHKGTVMRKMFPFDAVIMRNVHFRVASNCCTVRKYLREHYEFIYRYPVKHFEMSGLMKAHRMFVANRISDTYF